jgi:hypothetical protein
MSNLQNRQQATGRDQELSQSPVSDGKNEEPPKTQAWMGILHVCLVLSQVVYATILATVTRYNHGSCLPPSEWHPLFYLMVGFFLVQVPMVVPFTVASSVQGSMEWTVGSNLAVCSLYMTTCLVVYVHSTSRISGWKLICDRAFSERIYEIATGTWVGLVSSVFLYALLRWRPTHQTQESVQTKIVPGVWGGSGLLVSMLVLFVANTIIVVYILDSSGGSACHTHCPLAPIQE